MKEDDKTYTKKIGSLDTKQFRTLQIYLDQVDVPARMAVLYNQLAREIEAETEEEKESEDEQADIE